MDRGKKTWLEVLVNVRHRSQERTENVVGEVRKT